MKKTLHIDDKLLQEAKAACGAKTETETVRLDVKAIVLHAACQRLGALRGTEKNAVDVPIRRERPLSKRKVAR